MGLALLVVPFFALGQAGCSSLETLGCKSCGLPRPRFFQKKAGGCFGCGRGGATAVDAGSVPYEGGAVIVPGGTLGSAGATGSGSSSGDPEVPDLTPAPGASDPPSGANSPLSSRTKGRTTSSGGTSYSASKPMTSRARGRANPVAALPTFEPAPGPASKGEVTLADRLLDSLPEPAGAAVAAKPAPAPKPADAAKAAAPAPEATEAAKNADSSPPPDAAKPEEEVPAGAAPGIAHFKGVEPQLAGGSLPTKTAWAWLSQTSYKTLLDLREPGELQSAEMAQIAHQGFRYVALPTSLDSINAEHMKRFEQELNQANARPLYFFDTDGTRAAALWYVRRITLDHVDPQTARREAEELGPLTPAFLAAADKYLKSLAPVEPAETRENEPTPPREGAVKTDVRDAPPSGGPQPPAVADARPPAPTLTPATPLGDPTAWRPFAALILTVLGVPLAYWGRSGLTFRTHARASLTASAPSRKSLPASSGVGS